MVFLTQSATVSRLEINKALAQDWNVILIPLRVNAESHANTLRRKNRVLTRAELEPREIRRTQSNSFRRYGYGICSRDGEGLDLPRTLDAAGYSKKKGAWHVAGSLFLLAVEFNYELAPVEAFGCDCFMNSLIFAM